ncbi:MAG: hypothetical protein JEZ06_16695 [Anaerolineaceae bacterium]|nr:hypothetical protein [Anaerolineaceae bacterium]
MNNLSKMTPEILVPRIGDYLVEKGLITEGNLQQALDIQREIKTSQGVSPLIGQILIDHNFLSHIQLDEAVTEQIITLKKALEESNSNLESKVKERTIELEQALSRLSELNEMKTNFVSNISHELRTPLTHVKGYVDLLDSEMLGNLNEEQKQAISILTKASDRLGQLIDDLILFTSVEREEFQIIPEPFSIANACHSMANRLEFKAKEKNIAIIIEMDNPPLVEGDEEKISWVIHQLLDNAIKFTPENGEVKITSEIDHTFVSISLLDNGIGIPDDRLDEIFEPFHQLDGSSTRKHGGTGLGLALARRIIEAHGTKLHVKSIEGKGTTFRFLLKTLSN